MDLVVASLQLEDGSFQGDQYGEIDSRFVFTAIQTLSLLDRLSLINTDKTVEWILRCKNFDGGFGLVPGAESHAAQIFVCVGTLSILNKLDLLSAEEKDTTCWWLAERQTKSGGLNGRPEKLPDVCYSWWVLSALAIFKRLDWIDGDKLRAFILAAQNEDDGGIADREGDEADVFHTIFGIAGLSLLGYEDLELIDPTYCLPAKMIPRIKNFNKSY
ncbi:hypothetical protein D0Z00_000047 [Geotrichum galactomycetum]|uniref:Uncharacterized protein n=1 Tax=Geotrichum galactomycetum TaxID=27317 RepID=A0ACB6VAS5_9ASCO|nr:hypothetical protein D0Z00_000047 [Geotrichum candidum]